MRFSKTLFFALIIICAGTLRATAQVTEPPIADPEPVIEVSSSDAEDAKIDARIENIFSKIDGIKDVDVKVESGVVTLSGAVANEAFAIDAKDIAIRTAGVVTVEDQIDRTLNVRDNVTPILTDLRDSLSTLTRAMPLIILALLIFLIFTFLGGRLARFEKFWRKVAPNPFLAELMAQAARIVMLLIGTIIALNLLGASKFVTTIIGGAGVMGIAIGFAVRDSLENYISSIMLSLRQPFRANDHVIINDREGIVVRLTSRATILMTIDGNHLRIPNSVVFKGIILNYSTNPERRFEFELGVDAEDNPIAAMKAGLDAMQNHDFVLKNPEPNAIIETVGDSNIVIKFMGWVDQSKTDFGKARSVAIKTVMTVLDEQGFTLPEPIYRLRFDTPIANVLDGETVKAASVKNKNSKKTKKPLAQSESLDVSPDTHLTEKASEERAQGADEDLLDHDRPVE